MPKEKYLKRCPDHLFKTLNGQAKTDISPRHNKWDWRFDVYAYIDPPVKTLQCW